MHLSEDALREALKRKDPGERFTKEVMVRVARQKAEGAATPGLADRIREFFRQLRFRPGLAGVLVAVLAAGGALGVVQYRRLQERRAGEAAKQQALLALRIANAKLNHVFARVQTQQAP